mmetsp:Transcript_2727/g.6378  ORF Transcript_2727/g.6378 Transcript_2727/m.6378 type:complete len:181 (-) Transcript_2727:208-750(-)|eukprot:CAMPEP_0171501204 /NCGR_PEP_ID=MMETSP0958-20121227/9427_1 /TAXON_ID=87120 /ORGANISM="Aurantiochytrium limacinum, Strain ATCCMYA-1381" /LENGTH=180 /DNA_ID=CAMNT_0012035991 /DNA_START=384 /DNA_END=926 /DNA_ORIENTATION=+
MIITINIGFGFVAGTVLTIIFMISWIRTVINREKVYKYSNEVESMIVRRAGKFAVSMLEQPEVHETLTNLIAGGINAWLVNPEAQAHIEHLIAGAPQKEVAHEFGRKLPSLATSFTKGIFDGVVNYRSVSQRSTNLAQDATKAPPEAVLATPATVVTAEPIPAMKKTKIAVEPVTSANRC